MEKQPDNPTTDPLESQTTKRWQQALRLLVLACLVIFAGYVFIRDPLIKPPTPTASPNTPGPTDPAPMEASPALGPLTAPVTITEYADFGCPSCWFWYHQGVLDKLRSKYGDQIRFVWRDFPVITLLSPHAAEAGQCANEQGRFWEFHDAVYDHDGAIEAADLQAYAAQVGLDMTRFNECVTSRRYRERVNAEQTEAFSYGLSGTPAFLINNKPAVGALSLADLSVLIDQALAAKK